MNNFKNNKYCDNNKINSIIILLIKYSCDSMIRLSKILFWNSLLLFSFINTMEIQESDKMLNLICDNIKEIDKTFGGLQFSESNEPLALKTRSKIAVYKDIIKNFQEICDRKSGNREYIDMLQSTLDNIAAIVRMGLIETPPAISESERANLKVVKGYNKLQAVLSSFYDYYSEEQSNDLIYLDAAINIAKFFTSEARLYGNPLSQLKITIDKVVINIETLFFQSGTIILDRYKELLIQKFNRYAKNNKFLQPIINGLQDKDMQKVVKQHTDLINFMKNWMQEAIAPVREIITKNPEKTYSMSFKGFKRSFSYKYESFSFSNLEKELGNFIYAIQEQFVHWHDMYLLTKQKVNERDFSFLIIMKEISYNLNFPRLIRPFNEICKQESVENLQFDVEKIEKQIEEICKFFLLSLNEGFFPGEYFISSEIYFSSDLELLAEKIKLIEKTPEEKARYIVNLEQAKKKSEEQLIRERQKRSEELVTQVEEKGAEGFARWKEEQQKKLAAAAWRKKRITLGLIGLGVVSTAGYFGLKHRHAIKQALMPYMPKDPVAEILAVVLGTGLLLGAGVGMRKLKEAIMRRILGR